jgi:uncharacterized OB-fold protein
MMEYSKRIGSQSSATIVGTRCDRCGYTQLDNDDDVWSAVGL